MIGCLRSRRVDVFAGADDRRSPAGHPGPSPSPAATRNVRSPRQVRRRRRCSILVAWLVLVVVGIAVSAGFLARLKDSNGSSSESVRGANLLLRAASTHGMPLAAVVDGRRGPADYGSGHDRMGRFGVNRQSRTVALRPRTVPDPDGR
jgi:hypothetical protein